MVFDKIVLTPKHILEKEFKIDTRGYHPPEVDKFLDIIIKDYTEFISIIKRLTEENENLVEETLRLKNELRNMSANIEMSKGNERVTNVDIIRRLSHLEKIVYGKEE
jgi:DivIVA domain-containing protein